MTVYQVHHSWTPGEDEAETSFDDIPARVRELWEVEEGVYWARDEFFDIWSVVGDPESIELNGRELLEQFGPLTDDKDEIAKPLVCPICGPDGEGCAGHTRKPGDVLAPLSGGAA